MYLQALDIGETVYHLLVSGQRGTILAVVSNAIYLLTDSGELFWLTTTEIPRHPRCIRVPVPLPGAAVNMPFTVTEPGLLTIGPDTYLDCRRASIWSPPTFSTGEVLPPAVLPERVRAAAAVLDNLPSPAGLGVLLPDILSIATGDRSPFLPTGAFSAPVWAAIWEIARACLAHNGEVILSLAEPLIGLGEGLTPSGDDFVGGVLFCLYWLSRLYGDFRPTVDWADRIDKFSEKTHLISFTLLSDLARGQGVEPLHQWLNCVLTDSPADRVGEYAAQLVQIGHSSGWDLLSGAMTGLLWTFALKKTQRRGTRATEFCDKIFACRIL